MAAARPTPPALEDEVVSALALEIARTVVLDDRVARARRRATRRRRRIAGVTITLLLAVPPAAYAASQFLARTGYFGAAGMTEHDTSEWIDVCAPDVAAYVHSLPHPTDAPPPGMTWAQVADEVATQLRDEAAGDCPTPGAVVNETGVRSRFFFLAEGHWARAALADHAAGREQQARERARMVALQLTRLDELGVWGDDHWESVRDVALRADWDAMEQWYVTSAANLEVR